MRFIAARHYASRGHWDDAYAYVLRTRQDNIAEHDDTYNRNALAWHYTNARINELIQEAEQALELRDKQVAQWSPHRPPENSLVPPGQSVEGLFLKVYVVSVLRICRRFLKFAYVVVYGESLLTSGERGIQE